MGTTVCGLVYDLLISSCSPLAVMGLLRRKGREVRYEPQSFKLRFSRSTVGIRDDGWIGGTERPEPFFFPQISISRISDSRRNYSADIAAG